MNIIITTIILLYITITTIVSAILGKRNVKKVDDFVVASNKLGTYQIFSLIYASSLGIGSTVAAAELGFINGISAIWWEISGDFFIILAAFGLAKYLKKYIKFSIFEILERNFGVNTRIIGALLMSFGVFTMSIAQLIGGSIILSSGAGISLKWAVLLTTGIVLVILVLGGMRGLSYANIFHTTVSMIGTLLLLVFTLSQVGGIEGLVLKLPQAHMNLGQMGISKTFAWFLAQFFRFVVSASIIQIILSAKDTKTAIIGTTGGALGMLVVGISSVLIGMSSRVLWPNINPRIAESFAAMQMSPIMAGIVLSGIFASLTGTIAVYWLTLSTILTFDVFKKIPQINVSVVTSVHFMRMLSTIIAIIVMVFALNPQSTMLEINIMGISMISIVSILVLFAIYKKFSPITGLVGISGGFGCMLIWMALGEPFNVNRIYISTLSTMLFLLVGNLVFVPPVGGLFTNLEFLAKTILEEDQEFRVEFINDIADRINIRKMSGQYSPLTTAKQP